MIDTLRFILAHALITSLCLSIFIYNPIYPQSRPAPRPPIPLKSYGDSILLHLEMIKDD